VANADRCCPVFVIFPGWLSWDECNATGAIDTGIRSLWRHLKGHEIWMIRYNDPFFAIGGTTYGMAKRTLAFLCHF